MALYAKNGVGYGFMLSGKAPRAQRVKAGVRCEGRGVEPEIEPRRYNLSRKQKGGKLRVLRLVGSVVEANSDLAWFEQVAGRTAMIAFAVALFLEPVLPDGIFTWGSEALTTYFAATSILVASAAVLATKSRRSFGGLKIQKAVLSCITAFSRLASSNLQKSVDHALDIVFEQVFGSQFIDANFMDWDELID